MVRIIKSVPRMASRDQLFGQRSHGFTRWHKSKAELDARSGVVGWTIHDLRRTVATRMADLGVQPHVIEQVLNHQSGHKRGPAGIYNRSVYANEVRAALLLWEDRIRTLVEGGERKIFTCTHQLPLDAERGRVLERVKLSPKTAVRELRSVIERGPF